MGPEHLVIAGLFVMCLILTIKLRKAQIKIDEQELKILTHNHKRLAVQLNELLLNCNLKDIPKLSSTTEKLLALAAKSDNAGEASAAAVKACKRIHKELGYK